MLLRLILIFVALLHLSHAARSTQEYGVGFGLSLDYATASIYFENGSYVDIAKIEGGQRYKEMMRSPEMTRHENYYERSAAFKKLKMRMTGPFGSHVLGRYLPHWLRFSSKLSDNGPSHTESLYPMLKALKSATDAYLEEPCTSALTVTPFHGSIPFLEALAVAGTALSLRDMPLVGPSTLEAAAYVQGIASKCETHFFGNPADDYYTPPQLVLAVDYSRAALSCVLFFEECGVLDNERAAQNMSLGRDALTGDSHVEMARMIREVARLPVEGGQSKTEGLTKISHLFVTGELAHSPLLHNALLDGLEEHTKALDMERGRHLSVSGVDEPTFSAARGAARQDWYHLNPVIEYCASNLIREEQERWSYDSWKAWAGL